MADDGPGKNDIQLIFKRLRSVATNKSCFDCNAKNPTWSSVTYGVFICIDCSAVHRSLGVHLTFVRSTQLDTNWTWLQIRQMQLGGNANALQFFRQHNCTTTDAQQKYNSRAAQLYKEKLHAAAVQAMRIHGTKLHLESSQSEHSSSNSQDAEKKEVDFFEEHSTFGDTSDSGFSNNSSEVNSQQPQWQKTQSPQAVNGNIGTTGNGSLSKAKQTPTGAPSVDALLSPSLSSTDQDRKPTIGTRKPQPKRAGLGAKKGLGAQKVKGNFEELAREAELADQRRLEEATAAATPAKSPEEEEAQLASMRLAYQDLSVKQKREEEKLKAVDPKKAQQIERLGMGFASRSGISHSALTDMKTIDQETPYNSKSKTKSSLLFDSDNDGFFDDFGFTSSVSSNNFSMYKNSSPTGSLNQSLESMFLDHTSCTTSNKNKSSVISSSPSASTISCWDPNERYSSSNKTSTSSRTPVTSSSGNTDAQKKFGAAKAISSDQYFGDSRDNAWEQKTNLSRFEGSTSISSADYFGRAEATPGGAGIQAPDLEDVKESVRQGVTKVAGKLSSLANGVMSSISQAYSELPPDSCDEDGCPMLL